MYSRRSQKYLNVEGLDSFSYFFCFFQSFGDRSKCTIGITVTLPQFLYFFFFFLTDKMKRSFFQRSCRYYYMDVSILPYGCTTWTLTKRMEKKFDGNYTKMLRAILNKSWRKHPTNSSCTTTYLSSRKLSQTRHAGHCWRSGVELISDVLLWTLSHSQAKSGRPTRTYIQ